MEQEQTKGWGNRSSIVTLKCPQQLRGWMCSVQGAQNERQILLIERKIIIKALCSYWIWGLLQIFLLTAFLKIQVYVRGHRGLLVIKHCLFITDYSCCHVQNMIFRNFIREIQRKFYLCLSSFALKEPSLRERSQIECQVCGGFLNEHFNGIFIFFLLRRKCFADG